MSAASRPGPDAPIEDSELPELFAGLARRPRWALAVSGGVDSIVLMHLVERWLSLDEGRRWAASASQGQATIVRPIGLPRRSPLPVTEIHDLPSVPVVVFTVDHDLRPASADDATFVTQRADAAAFPSLVLTWHRPNGGRPTSAIQSQAREARYGLMADVLDDEAWVQFDAGTGSPFDRGANKRVLVTAHHRDDQVETFLMRLRRGSGIDGLSAMRPVEDMLHLPTSARRYPKHYEVHRPLLGIPKSRLLATALARGLVWRDDPTNADPRGERVRVRQSRAQAMAALGLTDEMLSLSIRRLQHTRTMARLQVEDEFKVRFSDRGGLIGGLDITDLTDGERAALMIAAAIARFGDATMRAEPAEIARVWHRMRCGEAGASTLGGAVIERVAKAGRVHLRFWRELGRDGLEAVTFAPGDGGWWDYRFAVSIADDAPGAVTIRAHEAAGLQRLRECEPAFTPPSGIPSKALLSAPAAYIGDAMVWSAVLDLRRSQAVVEPQLLQVAFRPVLA